MAIKSGRTNQLISTAVLNFYHSFEGYHTCTKGQIETPPRHPPSPQPASPTLPTPCPPQSSSLFTARFSITDHSAPLNLLLHLLHNVPLTQGPSMLNGQCDEICRKGPSVFCLYSLACSGEGKRPFNSSVSYLFWDCLQPRNVAHVVGPTI